MSPWGGRKLVNWSEFDQLQAVSQCRSGDAEDPCRLRFIVIDGIQHLSDILLLHLPEAQQRGLLASGRGPFGVESGHG